jgi:hypothetical protein
MRVRLLRSTVLLVALGLSAASGGSSTAVSRPPPYPVQTGARGPDQVQQAGPVTSVADTGFTGTDGSDRINFYFRKDGVLHYRDPQGWWEDGHWQQTGRQVTFTLSDGFATYTGTLAGGMLSGDAVNKNGKGWKFSVRQGTPRQQAAFDLTGSSWGGKEDKTCIVFQFKPGGVLEYDTPSGHYADGTWEVDGEWVFFKHKGTGFEYFGSLKADHMNGNLWSTDGQRWSWDVNKGVVPLECAGGGSIANGGKGSGGTPPEPAIASIEGTVWQGDNGGDATTFKFNAGGVLLAKDPQGNWKGSWFQNGSQVSFDLNGRFSWYEGAVNGTSMTGAGHNKDGLDWKFVVTRK